MRFATEGVIFEHVRGHVVGLAMRQRNDHGILLDTKLGVVFWHEAATEFIWFSPFPVISGLATLRPHEQRRVVDGWYGLEANGLNAVEMVKEIYCAHGWPNLELYRKEDCLKAIHAAFAELFTGEWDSEDEEDGE
ncbi:hypothetical protein B0T18DRAFT_432645 [Schizothecium vesticola]|uniref:Uncharacterized protein n=1 Tax=Schizothecium vesticola TaxID=314040 RepID=A0AA40K0L5_9PEZI|nr:hypothetical protein B0T18DRAFT_432645 [Schizothecium vesticola]